MAGISAVVLAGGRGSRLGGVNKARMEIGGVPLLERVLGALRPLADQIVAVGHLVDENPPPDVEILPDPIDQHSTLVAIYTGLSAARNDIVLVVGCDMPFLSTPLLERIARASEGHDLAIPAVGDYLETLHAAYRRSCLPAMEESIRRRQFKIIQFFPRVRVRRVLEEEMREIDPDLRSFFNVNTPEDLATARALAQQS